MTSAEKRLQAIRDLLAHVRDRLGLEMGFVLWDGSTIPANLSPDALAIMIADEGAIAALIRRPKLDNCSIFWSRRGSRCATARSST